MRQRIFSEAEKRDILEHNRLGFIYTQQIVFSPFNSWFETFKGIESNTKLSNVEKLRKLLYMDTYDFSEARREVEDVVRGLDEEMHGKGAKSPFRVNVLTIRAKDCGSNGDETVVELLEV